MPTRKFSRLDYAGLIRAWKRCHFASRRGDRARTRSSAAYMKRVRTANPATFAEFATFVRSMRATIGMSRDDYPEEWKSGELQAQARARANHECEECGMEFIEGTNIARSAVRRDGKPMVANCHHIDGDRFNSDLNNLVFLCQACHVMVHRYEWAPGGMLLLRWRGAPPRWITERGIPWEPHPQLLLFEKD